MGMGAVVVIVTDAGAEGGGSSLWLSLLWMALKVGVGVIVIMDEEVVVGLIAVAIDAGGGGCCCCCCCCCCCHGRCWSWGSLSSPLTLEWGGMMQNLHIYFSMLPVFPATFFIFPAMFFHPPCCIFHCPVMLSSCWNMKFREVFCCATNTPDLQY